jgi:hypothetical protein
MHKDLCEIHGKIGVLVNVSSRGDQEVTAGALNYTGKSACDSDSAKSLRKLCQKLECAYSGSSFVANPLQDADTLESLHSCRASVEPLLVSQLSVRSFTGAVPLESSEGNANDDTQMQQGGNYVDGFVAINATQVPEQCSSPSVFMSPKTTPPNTETKLPTGVECRYRCHLRSPGSSLSRDSGMRPFSANLF